jgi:hypothetical protein
MTRDDDRVLLEQLLAALRAGTDLRHRKVRRLRAAIRARTYENPLKFEVATDRLATDLLATPAADDAPR